MLPIAASTTREKPKTPNASSPHIMDADSAHADRRRSAEENRGLFYQQPGGV